MVSWTITLAANKTVELSNFAVLTGNTVSFSINFVELGITRNWTMDFASLPAYLAQNPSRTWKDYAREMLLATYNMFALAKQYVDLMNAEAT